MTEHDPLASLSVPVPPYRGQSVPLPSVRLASADAPDSPDGTALIQRGSEVERQDAAAREAAVEKPAERPESNPLEGMALSLAIEQQEEAIKHETGQAHTSIDEQPPLNDADAAAKQDAHAKITGVEVQAVADLAAVGTESAPMPAAPEAPTAPEARRESPKEPEPGNPDRFQRFQVDIERLREMFAEKIAAAQDMDELYAAIRAADGNIVNERGVRYPADQIITNIEQVRRNGPSPEGFATSALGIRGKALTLLQQENPNFGRGSSTGIPEVMQGFADALREEVSGRVPPRPPLSPAEAIFRTPAEGVAPAPPETPSPAASEVPRAEAAPQTPEQQQIAQLRGQVEALRRQLEAARTASGAAEGIGTEQLPPLDTNRAEELRRREETAEYGPEQPETSGAAEQAMNAIEGVAELGTDQELSFWERKGMQAEAVLHDVAAWWAGAWAVRAKNSLKERERKVRSLEREAQRSAKSFTGALLNPIKYGWRINYHRWREGLVRGAWEKNNDMRMRYESSRNEVLSRVAKHMEMPLKSYEFKSEEYRRMIEGAETDLENLDGRISRIDVAIAQLPDGEDKEELMSRRAGFMEQAEDLSRVKDEVYEAWQRENAKAIRVQRINNQILKKQNPGDRPQTGGVVREILSPRARSPMPKPPATSPPGKLPPTRTP